MRRAGDDRNVAVRMLLPRGGGKPCQFGKRFGGIVGIAQRADIARHRRSDQHQHPVHDRHARGTRYLHDQPLSMEDYQP